LGSQPVSVVQLPQLERASAPLQPETVVEVQNALQVFYFTPCRDCRMRYDWLKVMLLDRSVLGEEPIVVWFLKFSSASSTFN
jgi:hypothetical protein